jgi:hypothetical protein
VSSSRAASSNSGEIVTNGPQEHGSRLARNTLTMADSIGIALDAAGPTVSIAPTLAAVVAASSFAGPIPILICGCPCWPSLQRIVGSTACGWTSSFDGQCDAILTSLQMGMRRPVNH